MVKEVENFISCYLEVYFEIKDYMINIVEFVKIYGYVEMFLNCCCYILELFLKVFNLREFGKCMSLNVLI